MGGIIGGVKNPEAIAYGTTTLYDKFKDKKTTTPQPTEATTQEATPKKRRQQHSALQIPTV